MTRYFPLRSEAVAWRLSIFTFWRRPVRSSHRSVAASPTAESDATAVSVMRKGVGNIGSLGPVISTSRVRSSDPPAIGKRVRRASLIMVGLLGSFQPITCDRLLGFDAGAAISRYSSGGAHS